MLRNKKGFSTMLLIVLGAIFFAIAGAMVMLVDSEGAQNLKNANSARGGSRLDFMAQTMQADFYNNFLQTGFERDVANFIMTQGPHTIDPNSDFMENLGNRLQTYLEERARSLIAGDANTVYAEAYSAFPDVQCTPVEKEGAVTNVGLRDAGNGYLEVSGWTVGQEVSCKDEESDAQRDILLEARDYRLQTRALEMHDKAVAAIKGVVQQLDSSKGEYPLATGWRVDVTDESRRRVTDEWNGLVRRIGYTFFLDGKDGIMLRPNSVKILPGEGRQLYEPQDVKVVCDGGIKAAAKAGSPAQTCRPENMEIVIGKKLDSTEKGVNLEFIPDKKEPELEAFIQYLNLPKVRLQSNLLDKLIGPYVKDMFKRGINNGYVKQSNPTRLCNAFKGKPSSAVISGTILETNTNYMPPGTTGINFDFVSPSESIDDSQIKNDETCEGKDEVIGQNIFALLTNYGNESFVLTVEWNQTTNEKIVKKDSLDVVSKRISSNDMFATTGENRMVHLEARVEGGELTQSSAPPQGGDKPARTTNVVAGTSPPEDLPEPLVRWIKSTDPYKATAALQRVFGMSAAELTSLGKLADAEAMSKSAATACKMMGLKNWLQVGDNYKALLAVCGIASIADKEAGAKICSIAGLYQTVKSGNVLASLEQLSNLLGLADFRNVAITAENIRDAVKAGNLEATLQAASSVTRLLGEAKAADYLAGAASLANNIKYNKDVLSAAASVFSALGDAKTAGFFASLHSLEGTITSGDARAILNAAGQVAQKLGYSGLAQVGGIITQGEALIKTLADFKELFNACSVLKWDWVCTIPQVGGGVCEDKWGDCTFSVGLPAFDIEKLCNDMIFDLGFQIDCECTYSCPHFPYVAVYQKSVGINLREIAMRLNPEQYMHMFEGMSLESLLASGDLMQYCRLDP